MDLISNYSLDGIGKQLSHRTRHSIISIRNNKAILFQKNNQINESVGLL